MTMIFGIPVQALLGQLLVGLINGSFYAMLSLGLAVIFGLLRVINFAHGAQYMLGAFVGCGFLALILTGKAGGYDFATAGLGQNVFDPAKFSMMSAFVAEAVGTFFFLVVILGSTQSRSVTPVAGLAIGLTLAIVHLVLIPITGTSVNPARSIAPAIYVGGLALSELWLFIVAPIVGAVVAAIFFRAKLIAAE